jgi:hypothetical protein
MPRVTSSRLAAVVVVVFAIAMAYLESAVVVYLTGALGGRVGVMFPLQPVSAVGSYAAIEMGREAATLVMIASIGMLVGRTGLERLAWSAVVFGVWDIAYYGWLWVFTGWPASLGATDLLFLLPVPWVGPVWSPIAVSMALIGVGLAAVQRLRGGGWLPVDARHWAAGLAGGGIVILSYTLDAGTVVAGGLPGAYPWPVFAVGMGLALGAAAHAFR